jgi:hypothetical protein
MAGQTKGNADRLEILGLIYQLLLALEDTEPAVGPPSSTDPS